jgi:hypothetical protein
VTSLPPPPDRSPLAGLEDRRRYLGDPEIAYRLPDEGLLILGAGWAAATDGATLSVITSDRAKEVALDAEAREALASIWSVLWQSPSPDGISPTVLLRYRGAFRAVSPPHDVDLQRWLARRVAP